MLPYKTLIHFDRKGETPIYIQMANSMIQEISSGRISSDTQLPSSRKLAEMLEVHRKTIVATYDELEAQGWVYKKPSVGTFVIGKLPEVKKLNYSLNQKKGAKIELEFNQDFGDFYQFMPSQEMHRMKYYFDDGLPDARLVPLKALGKEYARLLQNSATVQFQNHVRDFKGDYFFRQELARYLKETRGISTTAENILITRGSMMAFYLLSVSLLKKGDCVVAAEPGFNTLNKIVELQGASLLSVTVDEEGLDVEALEKIVKKRKVKFVYVIPHHHHPTTVKLSPERRIYLMQLSQKYGFAILEDDYDFDFHYKSSPILPLASMEGITAEQSGSPIFYAGSFSKLLAPILRLGFLVGKKDAIDHLSMMRRYIDWRGDSIMERAVCYLIKSGEIKRYLNKAVNAYRKRRDVLCGLLENELGDWVQFQKPEGGLAVWAQFDSSIDLQMVHQKALLKELYVSKPYIYFSKKEEKNTHNGIRMGFATMNEEELKEAFCILKEIINK